MPFDEGGLGILKLRDLNYALFGKMGVKNKL